MDKAVLLEESQGAPNHKIWGAQSLSFMERIRFSSRLKAKVRSPRPLSTARTRPASGINNVYTKKT